MPSPSRPNVLLILADDLGFGDLACFGNPIVRTPCLDRLCAEGLALTQHYSASPLCAPARAALLTGRYNHRTGAVDVPSNRGLDRISPHETTIADEFHGHGYATGMVGKWHNGLHDLKHHPNAKGFREFVGFLNGGMDYYQWVLDRNGTQEHYDGRYLTDVFTDEAVGFIRRHAHAPFFLYLAYNAPHAPLQAPEPLVGHYRALGGLSDEVCHLYAMIEQMDSGIGRVLETLRNLDIEENTIVLFTSDNGPWLAGEYSRYNGPFRGGKGDVWEGGIRVPAILRWPAGLPGGRQLAGPIHFCDWLPTLLDLVGVRRSGKRPLDGIAQRRYLLHGKQVEPQPRRFWQRNRYRPVEHCNAAVRGGDWKLVWPMRNGADNKEPEDNIWYQRGLTGPHQLHAIDSSLPSWPLAPAHSPELYNIAEDPGEACDLARIRPDRVAAMTAAGNEWFAEVMQEWERARRLNTH
jgi:arylsulfatase A